MNYKYVLNQPVLARFAVSYIIVFYEPRRPTLGEAVFLPAIKHHPEYCFYAVLAA